MFVRFRPICSRLAVILVANHREGRKVRQDHIGWLGSVALPEPIAARERVRFWSELDERFRAIAVRRPDRVSPDDRRKVRAALAVRIPRPTEAEEREAEIGAAIGKARLTAERRGKRADRRAPSRAATTTISGARP